MVGVDIDLIMVTFMLLRLSLTQARAEGSYGVGLMSPMLFNRILTKVGQEFR